MALNSVILGAKLLEPMGLRPSQDRGEGATHVQMDLSLGFRVGSTTLRPLTLGDREIGEGEGNGENVRLALMYEEFQGGVVMGGVPLKSKRESVVVFN